MAELCDIRGVEEDVEEEDSYQVRGLPSCPLLDDENEDESTNSDRNTDSLFDKKLVALVNRHLVNPSYLSKHVAVRSIALMFVHANKTLTSSKALIITTVTSHLSSDEIDSYCDSLLLAIRVVRSEIRDRIHELVSHKTKYVSYGIGSGCPISQYKYCDCENDLNAMRTFANKHNYYLGHTHETGSVPSIESILAKIRHCCLVAFEVNANAVIYYSGHANGLGDWWFYDGDVSLEMVLKEIASARELCGRSTSNLLVYIVADCCYAGQWCKRLKNKDAAADLGVRVIAATSAHNEAHDCQFSWILFNRAEEVAKSKVQLISSSTMEVNKTMCEEKYQVKPPSNLNKAELIDFSLHSAEKDQRKKRIAKTMKCEPRVTAVARNRTMRSRKMDESELVDATWFDKRAGVADLWGGGGGFSAEDVENIHVK